MVENYQMSEITNKKHKLSPPLPPNFISVVDGDMECVISQRRVVRALRLRGEVATTPVLD